MICPFCKYAPPGPEPLDQEYAMALLIDHVADRHCRPFMRDGRGPTSVLSRCFCGKEYRHGPMNAALRKHLEENGGLDAHAQDFLMGVLPPAAKGYQAVSATTVMTASGPIAAGQPVYINADGTVRAI